MTDEEFASAIFAPPRRSFEEKKDGEARAWRRRQSAERKKKKDVKERPSLGSAAPCDADLRVSGGRGAKWRGACGQRRSSAPRACTAHNYTRTGGTRDLSRMAVRRTSLMSGFAES
jgi:hypothetical protein